MRVKMIGSNLSATSRLFACLFVWSTREWYVDKWSKWCWEGRKRRRTQQRRDKSQRTWNRAQDRTKRRSRVGNRWHAHTEIIPRAKDKKHNNRIWKTKTWWSKKTIWPTNNKQELKLMQTLIIIIRKNLFQTLMINSFDLKPNKYFIAWNKPKYYQGG